ncbi:Transcriptional regulatory protein LiaR [Nonomuraea coxensis DSM 45129]|uniref:Transcriptional regulatory protein LiaR n=1 Tax=Nonomuraea coxensis DSM 45129 TaxID=1122611 RepID=A0ABX8TZA6_9ACTN|nr:response regulator transcription factor [Nonomuraea coxensis]QYC40051.1 Transcriptional regulatory protein LiaR [Nonomuraea coxensis DSM 45129]
MIRLLIVDDHPIVRHGLHAAFEAEPDIHVAGEAANGREGIDRAVALQVDIVLMDLRMPEMDGVTAITALRRSHPHIKTLVLTTFDGDSDVLPAIEAGASGYLLKDAPTEELLRAVRAAAAGEPVLSPSVAGRLMGQVRKPVVKAVLTDRELQVLALVADGASNRQAAAKLFISEASIKTHLLHIYDKLGVRDRAAAVGEGYRRGLLS